MKIILLEDHRYLRNILVVLGLDLVWAFGVRTLNVLQTTMDISGLIFYLFFGALFAHAIVELLDEFGVYNLQCHNDFEIVLFDIVCAPISWIIWGVFIVIFLVLLIVSFFQVMVLEK